MIDITTPLRAYTMPDDRDVALAAILAEMARTKTSWRQRMYGLTHKTIADGFLTMDKRGIKVSLLLDHTQSLGPTEVQLLHYLLANGFPATDICITTSVFHQFMHTKEAIVDVEQTLVYPMPADTLDDLRTHGSPLVIEGSLNFSSTAFKQDNTALFIPNSSLAQDALTRFDAEWTWAKTQEPTYQPAVA